MRRQLGVFIYDTINYALMNLKDIEDFINIIPDSNPENATLTKVIIPKSCASDAFRRLELMGFSATYLYGDHSGAVPDIYNAYNYNRKVSDPWDLVVPPPDDIKMLSES